MDKRVAERVNELGTQLGQNLTGVSDAMQAEMTENIPDLRGDQVLMDMLSTSIQSNLETITQVLRQVVDLDHVTTPVGAREYARRLAQRGVSPNALLRAYRIGQRMLVDWGFQIVERYDDDKLGLETYYVLSDLTFRYIDTISERVLAEYQEERERWLSHRSALQAEVLERFISGETVDSAAFESALGYRLPLRHLGVLLWTEDPMASDAELGGLDHALAHVAKWAKAEGAPLFWSKDRSTAWAWLPLRRDAVVGDPAEWERMAKEIDQTIKVALGRPATGAAGFRETHAEAMLAQRVALAARERAPRMTYYGDPSVRAASLLVGDLDNARRLVATALGGLAADSEPAERMRETVRVFLEEKGSYVSTAGRMHLHRNTVKYRIAKAVEERGRPIDEDRLDLELALIACQWLGPIVLRRPATV